MSVRRGFSPRSSARDRKSTRLNSSHTIISYAVFCLKKKNKTVYGSGGRGPQRVAGGRMRTPRPRETADERARRPKRPSPSSSCCCPFFFFFNDTATTEIYTLSLTTLFRSADVVDHERFERFEEQPGGTGDAGHAVARSEEHTSELQSHDNLVCRLMLEK